MVTIFLAQREINVTEFCQVTDGCIPQKALYGKVKGHSRSFMAKWPLY